MIQISDIFSKAISIIVGFAFLIGGLIFFVRYDPSAYDMEATGTITEIDDHYEYSGDDIQLVHDVYIDYSVGNKTYEHIVFFEYNSKMKVGDTVDFYYMSEDPSQIAGSDKEKVPYFSLIFAAIGLLILIVTSVRIVRKETM